MWYRNIETYCLHSLYDNNISAEGAKALADALRINTALTTLKWKREGERNEEKERKEMI